MLIPGRWIFNKIRLSRILFRMSVMIVNVPIILIIFAGLFSANVRAQQIEKIPCMVGYSVKNMVDVDPRDAEAALKVWAQELADQYGFHAKTVLYESADKLAADFVAGKIDFAGMDSVDFLRLEKKLKAKPEMTMYQNGRASIKYLALADANVHKKGLAGLRHKKLSVLKTNDLGKIFLDTSLMKTDLPPSELFFSAIQQKSKDSQAILDVFFGRSDLCVVPDFAFYTMKEMNPQVGRKLQAIAESPDLVATVGFFRPDWPVNYKKRAMKALSSEFGNSERGKQILLLFNFQRIDLINEEQLESIRELLADYDRLKKKRSGSKRGQTV